MTEEPNRGRGRIGLLVPFTNTNLEPDLALLAPQGISLHVARLGGYEEDAIPDEAQMAGLGLSDLEGPLGLLAGVRPDVILYGCTSATLAHGPAFDAALAERASRLAGAPVVTAAGAVVSACRSLGVTRVAFASPYVPSLAERAAAFLAGAGIEAVSVAGPEEALGNREQGALTPAQVLALGRRADHKAAEAILLSCTDMRAVEIVEALEAETGKPVITSNQAMMHAALPHLRSAVPVTCGRLLAEREEA
ncbi:MAG: aspartate/glutamate racemase family protein [Pseudomonadota bacterium]